MIKAEKWKVHIQGEADDIIAEMCCVVRAVYDAIGPDFGTDNLDALVKTAQEHGRIGDRS